MTDPDPGPDPDTAPPTNPAAETSPTTETERTDQPGAEAARYRRRLREAETERDTIAERLSGFQRREVERLAGTVLSRGDDIWLGKADVAELVDDAGQVDPEKVTIAVATVLDGRPQLRKDGRRPRPDPSQGSGRAPGQPVPRAESWQNVLRGTA